MKSSQQIRLILRAAGGDINSRSVILWRLRRASHLLYDHRLFPEDFVYDIGGYLGDWTARMRLIHDCHYHVFEPQPQSFQKLKDRFAFDKKVSVHEFAVGGKSEKASLLSNKEGSSVSAVRSPGSIPIHIKDICELIEESRHRIALLKLNIEGSEYDLLEKLLSSAARYRVMSVLVQFHFQGPESETRYSAIAAQLTKTHRLSWRYPFLWELWTPQGVSLSRREKMLPNARLI